MTSVNSVRLYGLTQLWLCRKAILEVSSSRWAHSSLEDSSQPNTRAPSTKYSSTAARMVNSVELRMAVSVCAFWMETNAEKSFVNLDSRVREFNLKMKIK